MLSLEHLVDRAVTFMVSDPWDFGTEVGNGPFLARILQARRQVRVGAFGRRESEVALLQLKAPFAYLGLKCEFLLVAPRLEGAGLSDIDGAGGIAGNFLRIPQDHALSDDPFDRTSPEAKTFALIGSLKAQPPSGQ